MLDQYIDFFENNELRGKAFNTTGVCSRDKHYMVNIDNKLKKIIRLIQKDKYFVINRPRQFGKTTTLNELEKILKTRYDVIKLDFQLIDLDFQSEKRFCNTLIEVMSKELSITLQEVETFSKLAEVIDNLTRDKEIILIIDEVDKAADNKLFLSFLGVLRSLYLSRTVQEKTTFKSVILAGVHDVKNLKLKFRDDIGIRYNSPWNIAVNFDIDMSFSKDEISTMLQEFEDENNLKLDINLLSKEIYKFTSGYPFLVSRICEIIDEKIIPNRDKAWTKEDIQRSIKILLEENNTLFDDLIKNMENNKELYQYMYNLLVLNIPCIFNIDNPVINLGVMFGYLTKDKNNNTIVSNKIIRERIYNYLISKTDRNVMINYNFKDNFITDDNGLDMMKILLKFQQFMKENYSKKDTEFLERHGVLLFLAFIKPIINGVGFDYKEVQISEERRLDIVIQYNNNKYVIETKIWHGDIAHQKGLKQLSNYLDIEGLEKGYLLIFNFNKNKKFTSEKLNIENREIFQVVV